MQPLEPIAIDDIRAAQRRISDLALRTPLIPLNVTDAPAEIYLKLENLQPIGSFKLRGAGNAMRLSDPAALSRGVWTVSTGNMAQGVGWVANQLGVPFQVVVPDSASSNKLAAIERLGGQIIKVTPDEWMQTVMARHFEGLDGVFLHPVCDSGVMAGHATIGLEICEDLPDVDAVVIPYGGGGLTSGVGSALRALKPGTRIFACEQDTAAPLSTALAAGKPVEIDYTPNFVDGIGGKTVLDEVFPLVRRLIDGALQVTVQEIIEAIRLLAERNRVIAEGAGAAPVAAALAGRAGKGKVVCIVSGGNLDSAKLIQILQGEQP